MVFPGFETLSASQAYEIISARLKGDPSILKELYRCDLGNYGECSDGSCEWHMHLSFFRGQPDAAGTYKNVRHSGKVTISGKYPPRDTPDERWPSAPISVQNGAVQNKFTTLVEALDFVFTGPSHDLESESLSSRSAT